VERFQADICGGKGAEDPAMQSCILGRLERVRNGRHAHTQVYADAWNECLPGRAQCRNRARERSRGKSAELGRLLQQNCEVWPSATEAETSCMMSRFTTHRSVLREDPNSVRPTCIDALQSCVRGMMGEREINSAEEMVSVADTCSLKYDEDERVCIREQVTTYSGLTREGVAVARLLCERKNRPHIACAKNLLIGGEAGITGQGKMRKATQNALGICALPESIGTACARRCENSACGSTPLKGSAPDLIPRLVPAPPVWCVKKESSRTPPLKSSPLTPGFFSGVASQPGTAVGIPT
jgi:hypothetical protein